MKKNCIIPLEIIDVTADGSGVGKAESGIAVFVPHAAVGDKISCRIVKVNKSYAYGIIEELAVPSPDREKSNCPVSSKCGGCTFRHISYESEIRFKDKLVKDAFTRLGGFEELEFEAFCAAGEVDRYRNKAQYPVTEINGGIACGFYGKRSHRVIPVNDCLLQPEVFSAVMRSCIDFAVKNKIPAYDEKTGNGVLRHIYLRRGHYTGEVMVCFVVKSMAVKNRLSELAELLADEFDDVKSVVLNLNPDNTNVILGSKNITLWGDDFISDTICGIKVKLSAPSFYQVNTAQAEKIYTYAKDCASLTGGETVVDLYCGIGTVGLYFADKAKRIIGGEIIPEAIANAIENALENGIQNAEFILGDAGKIAESLALNGITTDVTIIDPPRKGCSQPTLDSIIKMSPSKIIMISCNPATAARDAAYLCRAGYNIVKVKAFDLFSRTGHVECVVLLSSG
ncbi:MAG: 23S rRNA (uracil(1939)-C(5))-methyltransferase RlmD [Oscillospiraceae bacterium]|nr:23S rRNA (uracil(1939)-C(5))-methyltransferase RlmD [Oscillospiraceae bacterium]